MDVRILDAKMVGKDTMCIKMKVLNHNKKLRYKAGQYLFLCCPEINETEYHPFTITSAPQDSYFSVHIRCRPDMDWTYRLREIMGYAGTKSNALGAIIELETRARPIIGSENMLNVPNVPGTIRRSSALAGSTQSINGANGRDEIALRIDGPYGSASEEVFDFDTVILVGAGL